MATIPWPSLTRSSRFACYVWSMQEGPCAPPFARARVQIVRHHHPLVSCLTAAFFSHNVGCFRREAAGRRRLRWRRGCVCGPPCWKRQRYCSRGCCSLRRLGRRLLCHRRRFVLAAFAVGGVAEVGVGAHVLADKAVDTRLPQCAYPCVRAVGPACEPSGYLEMRVVRPAEKSGEQGRVSRCCPELSRA